MDPALADDGATFGNQRSQQCRGGFIGGHPGQIPVVDADNLGAGAQRPFQLRLVVHLDDGRHANPGNRFPQTLQLLILEDRDDQQHSIGASGARRHHLDRIDDEVLAEDRTVNRGPDLFQMQQAAAEELRLRQHRYRRGATRRVAPCQLHRVIVALQQSARW